ncbi:hypothetical protein ACFW04_012174 [Cataglyphis niger]
MAAPKESSFVNSAHVCDTDKTSNVESGSNDRRNEQRYLFLSITYGLNASYTKKLHVGLQAIKESCFVPIVKLTGNYVDGICLDIDTCEQFQAYMKHITLYLNESPKINPSPIIINPPLYHCLWDAVYNSTRRTPNRPRIAARRRSRRSHRRRSEKPTVFPS